MKLMVAFFAGGCFWCMESDFEKVPGVTEVESGYIGGSEVNPTYEQVSAGKTGHTEAVKVVYDSSQITYTELLEKFWLNIDPTVKDRQFCDSGAQYRSGVYYQSDKEKDLALASKELVTKKFANSVVYTEVEKATTFYKAEDYHQNYYKRRPLPYKFYRYRCGRDATLKKLWGSPAVFPGSIYGHYQMKQKQNIKSDTKSIDP